MDALTEPWLVHATHTELLRAMLTPEHARHKCTSDRRFVDPLCPPYGRIVAETRGRRKTTAAAQVPARMRVYVADADEITVEHNRHIL